MRARRPSAVLALVLAGTALLSSCASTDPDVERREALNDVVDAANERDADALRSAVDAFSALVSRQNGESLDADEVARLRQDAQKVKAAAVAIDADVIARRRAEQQLRDEKERQVQASVSASIEASIEASVAASVSASAAAEQERQEAEASASATPSPTPVPTLTPGPDVLPSADVDEQDD